MSEINHIETIKYEGNTALQDIPSNTKILMKNGVLMVGGKIGDNVEIHHRSQNMPSETNIFIRAEMGSNCTIRSRASVDMSHGGDYCRVFAKGEVSFDTMGTESEIKASIIKGRSVGDGTKIQITEKPTPSAPESHLNIVRIGDECKIKSDAEKPTVRTFFIGDDFEFKGKKASFYNELEIGNNFNIQNSGLTDLAKDDAYDRGTITNGIDRTVSSYQAKILENS